MMPAVRDGRDGRMSDAPKIRNTAREKMEAGGLALGVGLRQARTPDIAKMMKTCGYDWLFIDMEHNTMPLDTAIGIANAAQDAGIAPIVRVPGYEHWLASKALDGGALGIVFPHVDSAEQAARCASFCRYPPVGKRSVAGAPPQLDFRTYPQAQANQAVNEALLIVTMIESPAGLDEVEKMAAVPGVDAILIGTNDLCLEMGLPGQIDHPRVKAAYERVIAACRANGKFAGMGGVYNPAIMQGYIEMGMQLILAGNDSALLMQAAKQRHDDLRKLKP